MTRDGVTKTYTVVRWNIWMTVAKWCLTTNQLQGGFNCHLHQLGDVRVMEENVSFFSMCMMEMRWVETVHDGERQRQMSMLTQVHTGRTIFPKKWQYCLRRGAPVPSCDEDESNYVLTWRRFIIQPRSLSPKCSWRILVSQNVQSHFCNIVVVWWNNIQTKPPLNMSMLWQTVASLDSLYIIRVESALLSLNRAVFSFSHYCHTNPNFLSSDH